MLTRIHFSWTRPNLGNFISICQLKLCFRNAAGMFVLRCSVSYHPQGYLQQKIFRGLVNIQLQVLLQCLISPAPDTLAFVHKKRTTWHLSRDVCSWKWEKREVGLLTSAIHERCSASLWRQSAAYRWCTLSLGSPCFPRVISVWGTQSVSRQARPVWRLHTNSRNVPGHLMNGVQARRPIHCRVVGEMGWNQWELEAVWLGSSCLFLVLELQESHTTALGDPQNSICSNYLRRPKEQQQKRFSCDLNGTQFWQRCLCLALCVSSGQPKRPNSWREEGWEIFLRVEENQVWKKRTQVAGCNPA